jgi:hypothetical protein
MIKGIATVCFLALGTTAAFANTPDKAPAQGGAAVHAKSHATSKALNANAKMKKGRMHKAHAAKKEPMTATNGNWFGDNKNNGNWFGNNNGNTNWFNNNAENAGMKKGKASKTASSDMNNDWFGSQTANDAGMKKSKASKPNENGMNTNWFAPNNASTK